MYRNESFVRAYQRLMGSAAQPPSLLQRIAGVVLAATVFVLMLMFSVVAFAVVAAAGTVIGGWLWWKTRGLRRQMRENPPGGLVLEGEVIREVDTTEESSVGADTQDRRR